MKHELNSCLGARINGLTRIIDAVYRKHLKENDVTPSQLSIMMLLYKIGMSEQHEVAEALHFETSSLTRILVRLINQGFVIKKGAINRPIIGLTPTGIKKVKEVLPAWENAMDELHNRLGKTSVEAFSTFEEGFK
ncbi:MarR family winged helix-turn-helix transcriptional regulator [Flagellimonas lutimaris]|uniref:MarR family winged helix-turn-helix transcriptional regulator n=1 Tax=Flagellimonas lutimaris TaxID=475082 RepID=UPI003F5CBEC2